MIDIKIINETIKKYGKVEQPVGFTFPLSLDINRPVDSTAEISNLDTYLFRKNKLNPVIKYVDVINGLDTNNGDTATTAYKTFAKIQSVKPDIAHLLSGNYGFLTSAIGFDIEIIAPKQRCSIFNGLTGETRTWSDQTGGVFLNVLTANIQSILFNHGTKYERLIKCNNLIDCQNTVGSWFKNTTTNEFYIHTLDGLSPANNSYILMISYINVNSLCNYMYLENIDVLNGLIMLNNTTSSTLLAENCKFLWSTIYNGLQISTTGKSLLRNCSAKYNFLDGFNYKGNVDVLEVKCSASYNGLENATGINNGSTGHDNCKIIRIGCVYQNNEGPQMHDVNNSTSWNIDCVAKNSTSTVAGNKSAFASGALPSETCKVWLDGCVSINDDGTFGAEDRTGLNSIYVRYCKINNIEAGTILTPY